MAEVITSAANPLVKRVRLLGDRRHRRREGAFVVAGIQPVWQAVEAGVRIETLIVAPDLLRPPAAVAMVASQESLGVKVARVSGELFGRITQGASSSSGLAAIVAIAPRTLAGLPVTPGSVFVALHEAGNPGNLGTIVRTASAAGAAGLILIGPSADPHDPAAVKASMGAVFDVPVAHAVSAADFGGWAAAGGVAVWAATARAGRSLWQARLAPPLALLLGSEGSGLPGDLVAGAERAGTTVAIPMTGTAESLNLAVAAGVLLYEARRQGGPAGPDGPDGPGGSA